MIRWLGESKTSMAELLQRKEAKKPKDVDVSVPEVATLLEAELLDHPRAKNHNLQHGPSQRATKPDIWTEKLATWATRPLRHRQKRRSPGIYSLPESARVRTEIIS